MKAVRLTAAALAILGGCPSGEAASSSSYTATAGKGKTTCQHMKEAYRSEACCGSPTKEVGFQIVPDPKSGLSLGANPCAGKKPKDGTGAEVTAGFTGGVSAGRSVPNTEQYFEKGLCPVNVH